ncbi:MAG TPA: Flp pilus assembly protein CpaB [Gemmataceae bacterium]|nr:Flp pilus assembly protein CpaB [Gemmataceae bacterium]
MTIRTVLIVVLAVVFGVAAAVYATNTLNKTHDASGAEKVPIVITVVSVSRGNHLTAAMLEIKQVAKEDAPEDALHSIEDATRNGGRVAAIELVRGDVLRESKLGREGIKEGMAPLIRKNENDEALWMQAATILTPTAAAGVGGFIRPGDRVDVLLTVDHFQTDDRGGTVRLMQRVEVLATDNRMDPVPATVEGKVLDRGDLRYVTLLVTPTQAQKLALAQKQGTLTLILRNPEDTSDAPSEAVTAADLKLPSKAEVKPEAIPAAAPKVVPPPPPPPPIVIVRGGAQAGSAP